MKLSNNRVAELTCQWGKPCTWSVKPKIVNALPAIVEPNNQTDIRQLRKAHQAAALRVILQAAA